VFKPSFEVEIENTDGEKVETETTNKDEDKKVKPLTQETFELEIQTPQTFIETGENEWTINIKINSGDTYIPTLKGIPDGEYTDWLIGTLSGEETTDIDDDLQDILSDDPYSYAESFWFDMGIRYKFDNPSTSSETDTSGDSTQDTTTETTDTSTDTETQEETEENNDTQQEEKGILESIIESIVNFFKGIFG